MQIDLREDSEEFIERQIASGRYANPAQVISAALELLFSVEREGSANSDDRSDP